LNGDAFILEGDVRELGFFCIHLLQIRYSPVQGCFLVDVARERQHTLRNLSLAMELVRDFECGFESHPKTLPQYLHIAVTVVAPVHIGRSAGSIS
jgi:hypothetical protein